MQAMWNFFTPMTPKIHELNLHNCGKIQFIYLPTTLKKIAINGDAINGGSMDALLLERIGHMISVSCLTYLGVYCCPNMNIPMSGCHSFLVQLSITDSCDSLTTFPLDLFPALCNLDLYKCRNLRMISQGQAHNHLMRLTIRKCPELERMHILLPSLHDLHIADCPKVESFSDGGLPKLKWMCLQNASKFIASLKRVFGSNSSPLSLVIEGVDDLVYFPEEGFLPLSLTSLTIRHCRGHKELDYKGLCHLSSLKELVLNDCPSLKSLPEEGLPKSISILKVYGNCRLLKQRCRKSEGEDWPKLSHIQHLSIK